MVRRVVLTGNDLTATDIVAIWGRASGGHPRPREAWAAIIGGFACSVLVMVVARWQRGLLGYVAGDSLTPPTVDMA